MLTLIVLDTNVVSELMRPGPAEAVVAWVRAQEPTRLCTTAVTVAEILYGIERLAAGRRQNQLRATADSVFSTFAERTLPFDSTAAIHYADMVIARERSGAPISGFDAQIAAICRGSRARLATRNIAEFDRLGLDLVDPWRHPVR